MKVKPPKSKRGRGRPAHPAREAVMEVARVWIDAGCPSLRAVREVIDLMERFGGVSVPDQPPIPGPTGLINEESVRSIDNNRLRAAVAAWERAGRVNENPAWAQTTLDNRDPVVEQIVATIRRRRRKAAARQ